jgi:hypothetical protein
MLNVIMLNAVMLSVLAPPTKAGWQNCLNYNLRNSTSGQEDFLQVEQIVLAEDVVLELDYRVARKIQNLES